MRTAEEIIQRMHDKEDDDFLGFYRGDLIQYLTFEQAKPFINDDAVEDEWGDADELTDEAVKAKMLDYMEFAWGKANDCRGISASRSVEHYKAWLWLLGDDLEDKLDDIYEYYGKPCLRVICEKYGWDWRQWDDGEWRNYEDRPGMPPPETIEVPA